MSDHHGPHISPLSTYFKVYGSLLALTILTVTLSTTIVPAMGISSKSSLILAMMVASVKATLVGTWFMHLKWDKRFNLMVFLSAIWFVSLFFMFTILDLSSRGAINSITDNFSMRQDVALEKGYTLGQKWEVTGGHGDESHGATDDDHGSADEHGAKDDHGAKDEHAAKDEDHADAAVADAGADDFDEKATFESVCGICHGTTGAGDGVAGAAMTPKPANFTDAAFWTADRDDAHLNKVIKEGGASVGKSPLMAAYGTQYSDAQIAQLVQHLHTLKPAE